MASIGIRTLGGAIALAALATLMATPASAARGCPKGYIKDGYCYQVAVTRTKLAKRKTVRRTSYSGSMGYTANNARMYRAAPTYAYRRSGIGARQWHGWGASFHHEGVRYPGGNPRGPASSYNNWEGGFHPTVYWKLQDRSNTP